MQKCKNSLNETFNMVKMVSKKVKFYKDSLVITEKINVMKTINGGVNFENK